MFAKFRVVAATFLGLSLVSGQAFAQAKFEPTGNVVYHGASLPDVWSDAGIRQQLAQYDRAAGKKIAVITWFASLYEKGTKTSWNQNYYPNLLRVKRLGAVSLIKFSTQDYMFDNNGVQAPLQKVANGTYDDYFKEAASAVKRFGSPVFISIDHEMNGTWYPYSQAYDKGATATASDFIAAWQRIVNIFRQNGANNAAFVWSPNVPDVGGVSYKSYYPGDTYVDWIGVSLYSSSEVTAMDDIYRTYAAKKPFFVTEWATSTQKNSINRAFPGDPTWIEQFFAALNSRYPRVKAISWFNWDKGDGDHRLQRVPQQAQVYEQDVSSSRYLASAPNLLGTTPTYEVPPVIPVGNEIVLKEVVPVQNVVPVAPRTVTPPTVAPPVVAPPVVAPPVRRSLLERVKIEAAPVRR